MGHYPLLSRHSRFRCIRFTKCPENTQISGKSGQNGSKSVKNGSVKTEPKNRLEPASLQGLVPKRVFETLVEVAGIEPASRNLSDSASTCVVHLLLLA